MTKLHTLCKECIRHRVGDCTGKDVTFANVGRKPCKLYKLDPQLVSNQDIEPGDAPPSLKDRPQPQIAKRLIPENVLPTNKAKAANFERLVVQRLTKLLDGFRVLGNLNNKANYEWTQEQVDMMLSRIRSATDVLEKKFEK
jgi:hypothetical protein